MRKVLSPHQNYNDCVQKGRYEEGVEESDLLFEGNLLENKNEEDESL